MDTTIAARLYIDDEPIFAYLVYGDGHWKAHILGDEPVGPPGDKIFMTYRHMSSGEIGEGIVRLDHFAGCSWVVTFEEGGPRPPSGGPIAAPATP